MGTNQLTEKLFAEGYTKENHPDYVEWSHWNNFEYTREYLAQSVWETPCGLLKKGIHSYNHSSHMGVDYCPENNNPRFGCPYYDEKPCPHRYDTKVWGWNCVYHQTNRPYDYEQSVEKLWHEWDMIQYRAWLEIGGQCACMVWDRPKRKYVPRFNIENCIYHNCQNEVCLVTKRPRNLERVNIFYDILRVKRYKIGLIEQTEKSLEKGVRVFKKPVARTDAEIWLMMHKDELRPRMSRDDRINEHFSEHHGKTGFGEYEWFEFSITPQNIRIERRESRDLLQDLKDAAEGFEVIHASDTAKAAAQAKKERRNKAKEDKAKRNEQQKISTCKRIVLEGVNQDGETVGDALIRWAEKELARRGVVATKPVEQMSLFEGQVRG